MGWVRDTDYPNADLHVGYTAVVLRDGTIAVDVPPTRAHEVIGWESACGCGGEGETFSSRRNFHSRDGRPPAHVEGFDTRSATFAEWNEHLRRALPELDVHDYAKKFGNLKQEFEEAVRSPRPPACPDPASPRSSPWPARTSPSARPVPDRHPTRVPTAGRQSLRPRRGGPTGRPDPPGPGERA